LNYFARISFKDKPYFEEVFDIFRTVEIIDNLGWHFPLEFERRFKLFYFPIKQLGIGRK
jgi:hypothetical protein